MSPTKANMTNILGARDTNVPMSTTTAATTTTTGKDAVVVKGDVKTSMEYHRQVLQSKMGAQKYDAPHHHHHHHHMTISKLTQDSAGNTYVSPSDEIMSPCTAKLNAFRNKQVGKVKPKSLFAQASTKRMRSSEGLFGSKTDSSSSSM